MSDLTRNLRSTIGFFDSQRLFQISIVVVCGLVAGLIGRIAGTQDWGFREFAIVAIVIVLAVLLVAPNDKIVRAGFYLWIISFGIGWRQIWLTPILKFHPAEAFIWTLFLIILARRLVEKRSIDWPLSRTITVVLLFGVWGIITALQKNVSIDLIISEFKHWAVLVPIFYVSRFALTDRTRVEQALRVAVWTGLYVAILGLFEFAFPELTAPFKGFFVGGQTNYIEGQGFVRGDFTFWGGSIAGLFLVLIIPLAVSLGIDARSKTQKIMNLIFAVILTVGVYVAGLRGAFGALAAEMLAFLLFGRNSIRAVFVPLIVVVSFLPQAFWDTIRGVFETARYSLGFATLEEVGWLYDASTIGRVSRALGALDLIGKNPWLGNGWSASGWVHSDILQIGANLGLLALFFFSVWYIGIMWRLFIVTRQNDDRHHYAVGILSSLLGGVVLLATEGIEVLPQQIIPLWFLVAIGHCLVRLSSPVPSEFSSNDKADSPRPNL